MHRYGPELVARAEARQKGVLDLRRPAFSSAEGPQVSSWDSKKEEELHSQANSSVSSARRSKTRVFAKRARRDAHVDEKILCRRAVVVENDLRDCVSGQNPTGGRLGDPSRERHANFLTDFL